MLGEEYVGTSLSHATMRLEDLIPAFYAFLRKHDRQAIKHILANYGSKDFRGKTEHSQYLLEELFDALNDIAPEGAYFGAHEGDGSDYGFWAATLDW